MNLKPADPRVILKLLEGRKDVITPLAEKRDEFYRNQTCIRCGGTALTKVSNAATLFQSGDPMPRYLMQCQDCTCMFDPHTGLLLSMGNLGKAFLPAVPLLDGPEG
jgi:hypothetical protein